MNAEADVAVCPKCDEAFAISDIVGGDDEAPDDFDLRTPRPGTSFEETGIGWRLVASTRSHGAFVDVPFAIFWTSLTTGFTVAQIAAGEFTPFMALFLSPFVLATFVLWAFAAMRIAGKFVVSVERGEGRVFVGVGSIGWTRRFDWNEIASVEEDALWYYYSGSSGVVISLLGATQINFGSLLSHPRREWMLYALKTLLAKRYR